MLIGIVGKPSSGKSTFFKAATLAEVAIASYPFTTIKPNEGVGFVRTNCIETFFKVKCNPRHGECIDGQRFVPVKLIDVAGLVPGAHEGKGMGNQFLDDLRQADVLIHVVDIAGATNETGNAIKPLTYDPANDVRFLEEELDLWFYGILMRGWQKFANKVRMENKQLDAEIANQFSGLKINLAMVKSAVLKLKLEKDGTKWAEADIKKFARELRIESKPIIIAANKADVPGAEKNFERLKKEFPRDTFVACSAESEIALKEAARKGWIKYIPGDSEFKIVKSEALSDKQKDALDFITAHVLKKYGSTGVQTCLNTAVYDILKYMTIFPGGVSKLSDAQGRVLPDAFLLPPGSTALDFAYTVHTDFGKNFIRAIDVKTKRTVGKEHKLKEGDVVEIIAGK